MACVRKRRGKWVVDYRDAAGKRRWVTCESRETAEGVLGKKLLEARQSTVPVVDPDITLEQYARRWLGLLRAGVKPRTLASYTQHLDLHVLPALGRMKLRQITKGRIRALLAQKLGSGLAPNTVKGVHAVIRGLFSAAVDDELILANPASKLGRQLRLNRPKGHQEETKAMSRPQLDHFLSTAARKAPRYAPLWFTMARSGLRPGEASALQWEDLNFADREIRVVRTLGEKGRVDTPKSGQGRTVDMSRQLARVLLRLQVERKSETLKRGWPALPPWVFCSTVGTPLNRSHVDKAFKHVLKAAGLPPHFTPHCLRHTFASLLLQQGESPVYVQRQLGHSSIQLTVDLYGRWLPMGNKAAVDRLDDQAVAGSGSKTVRAERGVSEASDSIGPGGEVQARSHMILQ